MQAMHVARAQRFSLSMPVRYRQAGEKTWLDALTTDVSHTGVLMRTRQEAVSVGELMELIMVLPVGRISPRPEIFCLCRVNRVMRIQPCDGESEMSMAVAIERYWFARHEGEAEGVS
jgi:hypothetical protein